VSASRGQQAPPPIVYPPQRSRDSPAPPAVPCERCEGIPAAALAALRATLKARKEATR
jgi:hypothetical protein